MEVALGFQTLSNRVRQAVREGGGEGKGKRKLVRVVEM